MLRFGTAGSLVAAMTVDVMNGLAGSMRDKADAALRI